MKLPNYQQAIVPKAKIVDYLLSPTHADGWSKERFFIRFGFTQESWYLLAAALYAFAQENNVTGIETSPFGQRYIVEGTLQGLDGRKPWIRTIWFIRTGEAIPRFVTAYPLQRGSYG